MVEIQKKNITLSKPKAEKNICLFRFYIPSAEFHVDRPIALGAVLLSL